MKPETWIDYFEDQCEIALRRGHVQLKEATRTIRDAKPNTKPKSGKEEKSNGSRNQP